MGPATAVAPTISPAPSDSVSSSVTFNGVNVNGHDSLGSAIQTSFSGVFTTVFTWTSLVKPIYVTQGEIQLLFFGSAIGTSSVVQPSVGVGTITLNSSFTQNQYLFEGKYEIQATLLTNGTVDFQQDFYIWVQATNHLTVVNIALVLIGILEIWQIAALGSVKKAREQLGIVPPPKGGSKSGGT